MTRMSQEAVLAVESKTTMKMMMTAVQAQVINQAKNILKFNF
jgi:hypothetical protein